MRRPEAFAVVIRSGRRARRGALVVHYHSQLPAAAAEAAERTAQVGLVVGRSVGGSVQRHRVSRRLRAQLAPRLGRLAYGSGTVVRALPGAAELDSAELGRQLDAALDRLLEIGARS
jgi:ribonuclease P protein component